MEDVPAARERTDAYCIIGAGSSGITAAKNLRQLGIPFDVFERENSIGGNWCYGKPNSSVYRSIHLISSKPLTEYLDFPMPEEYPPYPNHEQVLEYFRAYVRHFHLEQDIQFDAEVTRVAPVDEGSSWDVTIVWRDGTCQTRRYRGVIICNGHNWSPKFPEYAGNFTGQTLHSCQYKTPDVVEGRRVLVIGAGNSGCDIAAESATHARATFLSTRRGYWYMPKFFFGRPVDQVGEALLRLRVPLTLRRLIGRITYRMEVGDLSKYGVKPPDHRLFETHPIVNAQLPYYIAHGAVTAKPDVKAYQGSKVLFSDDTSEEIDVIIFATGFRIVFPFIDTTLLNWQSGRPSLFLNVFHPHFDNLFVVGLIQPDSGQWGLEDLQAKLIARFIHAQTHNLGAARRFREAKRVGQQHLGGKIHYKESTRHYVEVEHYDYRRRVERFIAQLR